jgi:hypothetical protein
MPIPKDYGRIVEYRSVLDLNNEIKSPAVPIESDTFNHFYYEAFIGCYHDESPEKCQILANLCVLSLYDE